MFLLGFSLLLVGIIIVAIMYKRKTSFHGGLFIAGSAFMLMLTGFTILLSNFIH